MKYRLGDVTEFINGDRGKNYPSLEEINNIDGIPFVNAGLLDNNLINYKHMNYITLEKYNSLNSGKFKAKDILYCLRGSLGKKALVSEGQFGAIASSLVILRPNQDILSSKYLLFALDSTNIKMQQDRANNGSSQPNLSANSVKQYIIEIPTLDQQHKIVSILDQVNHIISLRTQQLEQLDLLVKSRFVEMFGDPVSNPMCWKQSTLGEECYYIKDGPHKSPTYIKDTRNGYPFISTRNVVNGDGIDWTTAKYISEKDYKDCIKKCHPEKGDILYSKGGTTGIAKVVDVDFKFANWVHLAVLKFGQQLNGKFLECMLNSDYCYEQSQRLTKGIANKDFVLSAIAKVQIFVPPIDLQLLYVNFVQQVDKSKFAIKKSLEQMETLKKKLMQDYFG